MCITSVLQHWVYPFCNTYTHTHTQGKRGNSLSMRCTIVDIYFTTHFPLCDNFLTIFTTRAAHDYTLRMNGETHTRTQEAEREGSCFATRKGKGCVSLAVRL